VQVDAEIVCRNDNLVLANNSTSIPIIILYLHQANVLSCIQHTVSPSSQPYKLLANRSKVDNDNDNSWLTTLCGKIFEGMPESCEFGCWHLKNTKNFGPGNFQ